MTADPTVLQPDPWLTHSAHITRVTPEFSGVSTYDILLDDPVAQGNFQFLPGQFNMLYVPGLGEAAISISGSPHETGAIPHTIRTAGNVTQALAELGQGASIGIRGPFGSSWPLDNYCGHDIVLAAGGIGMAPLRPAIYEILQHRDRYGSVTVLCGARNPSGLLYTREYAHWRSEGIKVSTTVDRAVDAWTGNVGVVTLLLDRCPMSDPSRTVLLTCGPEVMMWYTIQSALRRGLPQESIFLSLERNMNCAIGLCGHCQFGPHFVCRDGPVFAYPTVESILRVDDL